MKLGDLNLTSIKIGNDPIIKIYLGVDIVWESVSGMTAVVNSYESRVLADNGILEDKITLITFLEQ